MIAKIKYKYHQLMESNINTHRFLYVIGAIFYIIYWYLSIKFFGLIDPLLYRLIIVIEVITIFGLTYVSDLVRNNTKSINKIIVHSMNIHVIYLLIVNNLSVNVILFFLIYIGFAILFIPYTFDEIKEFNIYFSVTILEIVIALVVTSGSTRQKTAFGVLFGLFLIMIYFATNHTIFINQKYVNTSNRINFILNNSPLIIFTIDKEGIFQYSRGSALRHLDLTDDAVVGVSVSHIYGDKPDILNNIELAQKGQKIRDIVELSGRIFDVFYAPYTQGSQQHGVIGVGLDVTEQVEALDQLEEVQDLMIQNQKLEAVGRIASSIAHDFNNILSVISLNNELIKYSIDTGDYVGMENHVQVITENIDKASFLTERLLNVPKSRTQHPEIISITKEIKKQEPLLRSALKEDISLTIEYPNEELYTIIDPGHIDQIFLNLLINSRDAIKSSQSDGKVKISISEDSTEEFVKITFNDNGKGISLDHQTKLFEPFFTTKNHGSGLGLYSVKNIIDEAKGKITVNSEIGVGTTFTILLPKAVKDLDQTETPVELNANEIKPDEDIHVLIVEDSKPLSITLQHVLNNIGFKTSVENKAGSALKKFHDGIKFDLMITDIILPDFDGVQLANQALELNPELAILYISGYTGELEEDIETNKRISFLKKPFTSKELSQHIQQLLRYKN